jgi:intracellular sulfur oxidation DsrE/DsrF family protein
MKTSACLNVHFMQWEETTMKLRILTAATAAILLSVTGAFAAELHKLALHVDQNDPAVMNLALNNAANVKAYYAAKGEEVKIEIVAYGPGLKMYTMDSPVKERIAAMSLEYPDEMQFSACGNTLKKMSEKAGKDVKLLSEAVVVPAGVVRLMELHEDGYNYIRP